MRRRHPLVHAATRTAAGRARPRAHGLRVRLTACLAAIVALTAGACQDGTVDIAYRAPVGATASYEVEIRSTTALSVDGGPEQRSARDLSLMADHLVLEAGAGGTRVQVRLRAGGGGDRVFEVAVDRAGQLFQVQRIEGVPADALGDLGLSEIFPAAAGSPPHRRLAPGDRWAINEPLTLPGLEPTELRGRGRLAGLRMLDGREVAEVKTTITIPVRGRTQTAEGTVELDGEQVTRATVTHSLADGVVERVVATTEGRFNLRIAPPEGLAATEAVPGRLVVTIDSTTARLPPPA
ncbi:MAG: hypothetical protein ACRD0F_06995 [Acidimicrobiales bacterium]